MNKSGTGWLQKLKVSFCTLVPIYASTDGSHDTLHKAINQQLFMAELWSISIDIHILHILFLSYRWHEIIMSPPFLHFHVIQLFFQHQYESIYCNGNLLQCFFLLAAALVALKPMWQWSVYVALPGLLLSKELQILFFCRNHHLISRALLPVFINFPSVTVNMTVPFRPPLDQRCQTLSKHNASGCQQSFINMFQNQSHTSASDKSCLHLWNARQTHLHLHFVKWTSRQLQSYFFGSQNHTLTYVAYTWAIR